MTSKEALSKLKFKQRPATGQKKLEYLTTVWQKENMSTFKDILRWHNNKDVVPRLEAMQNMVDFYRNKGFDLLKPGCALPNLANICLHKSTAVLFYAFTESDNDLLEKIRGDMVGGPTIVSRRKVVADKPFIRDSTNLLKSLVGIVTSQFYPFSMCVKQCQLVCKRGGN